jgi:lipoprotein-anchoring transpeptidase ErfK/SrfK
MPCARIGRVSLAVGLLAVAGCSTASRHAANTTRVAASSATSKPKAAPKPKVVPAATLAVRPVADDPAANPARPITVRAAGGRLTRVVVTNPAGHKVTGRVATDGTSWTSAEDLGYGKTYRVSALAANSAGRITRDVSRFTTLSPANQTAATVFPATGSSVGVATIIDVSFDEPIADRAAAERVMKVTAAPVTVGAWHWMSDQEAEWRPAHFWRPGTTINVDLGIYGAKLGPGLYGQADTHASYKVHDDWRAVGDVNTYHLTVYHNGAKVNVLPVSFGKPSTPTHNGVHVISEKYPVYYMNSASYGVPANSPGGYANFAAYWALRISGDGEFLHVNDGTVGDQGYYNVSHGCVNLSMANGKWIYDHMGVGDPVTIVGGDPELPINDGYGGWNVSFAQWKANSSG